LPISTPSHEILKFLDILLGSLHLSNWKVKITFNTLNDIVGKLKKNMKINESYNINESDIILEDIKSLKENITSSSKELSNNTLLIIHRIISSIDQYPQIFKELGSIGFTKSILPINEGIAIAIKRGYNVEFFRKTVKVYRESFIHGPNPVDYNTALALYILAKFILERRKGVIVEIGTGRGFSTLWLAHAAKETSSRVISIDNKCDRVDYTKNVLKSLNLEDYVEILCTDAKNYDHGSKDIVYVFIDGKKNEYHLYLEALEPYLLPGALILAHNTLSDAHLIKPYIEKVYKKPYKSITIATDPKGLTISVYMHQ